MSISETTQTLPCLDGGTFALHQTTAGARAPGLVVISSVYGVTDDLRAMMARFAAHGFHVAAPEMFSRTGSPGALGQSDAERTAARGRLEGFDFAAGLADVQISMEALRARADCTGAVAVLGYCFGGEFAYLAAAQLGAVAAAAFHGVGIGKHLDQAERITVPMSLHFGAEDRFVPLDEVAAIEAAFRAKPYVEIYRYPGAKHGFAQGDVPAYDAQATRLAEERTLAMLARL